VCLCKRLDFFLRSHPFLFPPQSFCFIFLPPMYIYVRKTGPMKPHVNTHTHNEVEWPAGYRDLQRGAEESYQRLSQLGHPKIFRVFLLSVHWEKRGKKNVSVLLGRQKKAIQKKVTES